MNWADLANAHAQGRQAAPLPPTDDEARRIAREQCGGVEPSPEQIFAVAARLRAEDCAD